LPVTPGLWLAGDGTVVVVVVVVVDEVVVEDEVVEVGCDGLGAVVVGALVGGTVVLEAGVDVGGEELLPPPIEVPVAWGSEPTMAASGRPAPNSTSVMTKSDTANTPRMESKRTGQRIRRNSAGQSRQNGWRPSAACLPLAPVVTRPRSYKDSGAGGTGLGRAALDPLVAAVVPSPPTEPERGADPARSAGSSDLWRVTRPAGWVSPRFRKPLSLCPLVGSAWRTAAWVRSIEACTTAAAVVATALPMATPMIVPCTPKAEAMSAASTAPVTEAKTCGTLSFIDIGRDRLPVGRDAPGALGP
jgi:hypothetical protein